MGHMALEVLDHPADRMFMASPLLATLTVPEKAKVPRRRMGLLEILTQRLCPTDDLPVVQITDITPVRSMFDYASETAVTVTEMPSGVD